MQPPLAIVAEASVNMHMLSTCSIDQTIIGICIDDNHIFICGFELKQLGKALGFGGLECLNIF